VNVDLLDRALVDPYERKNKASRDYPKMKQEPGAGPPVIVKATPAQVGRARQIRAEQKKRSTAQEKKGTSLIVSPPCQYP